MRLIFFGLLFILMSTAPAVAQKFSYSKDQVKLHQLFNEIKRQTGYRVIWNEKRLDANASVRADFHEASLDQVFKAVLKQFPVTYVISGKMVVIQEKERRVAAPAKRDVIEEPEVISVRSDTLREVEIVSTGYQHVPRERATGSFIKTDMTQFSSRTSSDMFLRLEGITGGLLFNKNTLRDNMHMSDMSIRSRSTIFANDQPLIILNNFPFNGDLRSINPNDIESITLLKDAAAASIWGVRSGNGVIVLNTRNGAFGQSPQISFTSSVSVGNSPDLSYNPNYFTGSDYVDLEVFKFQNGGYNNLINDNINHPVLSPVVQLLQQNKSGALSDEYLKQQLDNFRQQDIRREYQKNIYRSPVQQQYHLSVSGGASWRSHYLSAGLDREQAALKYHSSDRATINFQNSFQPLKGLAIEAGLNYVNNSYEADSTTLSMLNRIVQPYMSLKRPDGSPAEFDYRYNNTFARDAVSRGMLDWSYTPLRELGSDVDRTRQHDLRLDGAASYQILTGLSLSVRYRHQRIHRDSRLYRGLNSIATRDLINTYTVVDADGVPTGYNVPLGGILYQKDVEASGNNARFQIDLNRKIGRGELTALAGYEFSEFKSEGTNATRYGYDPQRRTSADVDTTTIFPLYPSGGGRLSTGGRLFSILDRIRSVYINGSYTYNAKYTASASARVDGSNYFGVRFNRKNVPLWSAGLLWHVDREAFAALKWLGTLKLRLSHGVNGNYDNDFTGVTTIRYSPIRAALTNLDYATILNIGNPSLGWEKIAITNLGIDFSLRNQRLTGSLEMYLKNGSDILGDKAFPASAGVAAFRGNYADIKSRGVDLTLYTKNTNGAVKWNTNMLLSVVKDRVVRNYVADPRGRYYAGTSGSSPDPSPIPGRPVFSLFSYKWAGLDPVNGDPQGFLNGVMSKDYASIVSDAEMKDLEYNGPSRPAMYGGLTNSFAYRNFSLSVNLTYKLGYFFRKPSVHYSDIYNFDMNYNMTKDFVRRWQEPGDESITNVPSMGTYNGDAYRDVFYNGSSATVARADHLRLQDIIAGVDIKNAFFSSYFSRFHVYVHANNLGLLWKANNFGLDPDVVPSRGDQWTFRIPRTFAIGLKANIK